ncbi:MAG: hypothetical protein K2P81_04475 [Bacteriovoracaceae bacterium]|nr:hypothetical protein [Bacteriovoracaceae bacterium]
MGNRSNKFLKATGQSTVEYILLLAVVISLVYIVINSPLFKQFIGRNGTFAQKMKATTEWNYRFGSQGVLPYSQINYSNATHPSYWNSSTSSTHFFGPLKNYP